jgi:hypothetical protein
MLARAKSTDHFKFTNHSFTHGAKCDQLGCQVSANAANAVPAVCTFELPPSHFGPSVSPSNVSTGRAQVLPVSRPGFISQHRALHASLCNNGDVRTHVFTHKTFLRIAVDLPELGPTPSLTPRHLCQHGRIALTSAYQRFTVFPACTHPTRWLCGLGMH